MSLSGETLGCNREVELKFCGSVHCNNYALQSCFGEVIFSSGGSKGSMGGVSKV